MKATLRSANPRADPKIKVDNLFLSWLPRDDTVSMIQEQLQHDTNTYDLYGTKVVENIAKLQERVDEISRSTQRSNNRWLMDKSLVSSPTSLDFSAQETVNREDSENSRVPQDSAIDLYKNQPIPRFYFPAGTLSHKVNRLATSDLEKKLQPIFQVTPSNPGRLLTEEEFLPVTKACGINQYLSPALFQKVALNSETVSYQKFIMFNS